MTREELIDKQKGELRKAAKDLMDSSNGLPGPDRVRALIEVHEAERKLFVGPAV